MKRTLLIARREFAAYAKTVGFWLSLLAFPIFGVLGGAIPILMKSSEPVREVVVVEEGPQAAGLAAAVQTALKEDQARRDKQRQEAEANIQAAAGGTSGGNAAKGALSGLDGPKIAIVAAPADLSAAAPGAAREAVARHYLGDEVDKADRLDAVVLLNRADGKPTARVWSRRATDSSVQRFVRTALKEEYRREVFEKAGIDATVVSSTAAFDPDVTTLSPKSASGGEVSFRDQLPMIIGLASGFILWSLIITGASILLNSVMEEKSNKILEVLLSSASATEILTGKVLGVALLTMTVLLVWGGIGAAGLIAGLPQYAPMIGEVLLSSGLLFYFAAYAVGGYLMYAVLFAAIGAFCETPRDAQTLMGPIMMILVVPLLVMQMAIRTPDAPVVQIMSWIPFFTPFLMSARAPSEPPMIEIVGTMAGMFAFALLMVWVAGRAFRAGALSDVKLSWKAFGAAIGRGR
ncbi:ABC-2 type transport system permease protein [Brevundimonas alba]|uniref:ABC-2 type transport system permease protein n=1 Tax=Brevundimonas alba TaxID=74314 RepID=A0A7X6BPC0_9CAUL|nr:ABC transporter permease [Brevundimonas alba]NJC41824.1 ABC-2 type transport system permease protein [Brevundimonas alba]